MIEDLIRKEFKEGDIVYDLNNHLNIFQIKNLEHIKVYGEPNNYQYYLDIDKVICQKSPYKKALVRIATYKDGKIEFSKKVNTFTPNFLI